MIPLLLGLALFLGVHLVPTVVPLRTSLVRTLGENGYKGAFSLVSLLGFALLVWAKSEAPYVHIYGPPSWGRHVTMTLMLLSCMSLVAAYLPSNLKRFTAHPMMWGTALWAGGHLFANGDLASLLLFGAFFGYALFDMRSANRRGARPRGQRMPAWRDLLLLVVGLIVYAGLLWVHPIAFGVAVLR